MLAVSSEVLRVRLVPTVASYKPYGVFNPYTIGHKTETSKFLFVCFIYSLSL